MSVWVDKEFEERMQPHIDEAYRGLFTGLREISRSSRESDTDESVLFMDKTKEKIRRIFSYGDRYGVDVQ